MNNYFIVSLCKNGILGGGITVESEAIVYHTGKITVPREYRHLEMKYKDICDLTAGYLLILPTVLIKMRSGKEYKFVVFNRDRFVETIKERVENVKC